jgi:hypothetical protein
MSAWQGMSTAPKDGTRVFLAHSRGDVEIGVWDDRAACFGERGPGWQIVDDRDDYNHSIAWWPHQVTHWMPLPAPPEVTK